MVLPNLRRPETACNAGVAAILDKVFSASAGSEVVMSGLISAFPETDSAVDEAVAATVWALFQQACKHGHQLSAEAQRRLWLSQSGDCLLLING